MKYLTFALDTGENTQMVDFLTRKGIEFSITADMARDLIAFDYMPKREDPRLGATVRPPQPWSPDYLVYIFVILGEEDDLTAIKMQFNGITILKNRPWLKVKNFFRSLWPF